jgi:hypothetical protein
MDRLSKLRVFLRLPVIIGPLPNIILDGQLIDAVPVMNDFNWIVNQVNANVPPLIPTVTTFSTYVAQAAVGGTANAITLTPAPAIGAYAEGQSFRFRALNTNTGPVTIATSGLAVRAVQTPTGGALTGGEITAGGEYDVVDTGTVYMLMNVQGTVAMGTWTPALTFGGLNVGMTFTTQQGFFQKLNNLVFIWFTLQLSNKGTSAGTAAITGLPQIINASMGANDVPIPITILFSATALPMGSLLSAVLVPGTATLQIRMFPVSGGGKITYGQLDFNNNTYINGAGVYPC